MTDELEKLINSIMGDFFNYANFPKICIHTPIPDDFSHLYIANEKCNCGCSDFIDSEISVLKDTPTYKFPKKKVNRCKKCNQVRLATLKDNS